MAEYINKTEAVDSQIASEHTNKIKAIDPHIIVGGNTDKPYYSIRYYDTSDNIWHIGFSSYELKFVTEWLKTEFEIVESEIKPVRSGEWIRHEKDGAIFADYECSICSAYPTGGIRSPYCPNCGARLNGVKEREEEDNGFDRK